MFTGIIQAVGSVAERSTRDGDVRLRFETGTLAVGRMSVGDSIAVEGVCLTVVSRGKRGIVADVSRETLRLTTLGSLRRGAAVNLEPALTLAEPLGGHLVSGHVDGIGKVCGRRADARSTRFEIEAPAELARYIARKGSIAVNGVSLTVNEVRSARFGVNLVPHTLAATTLGALRPGDRVNLEVDQLARYLERLLAARGRVRREPAPARGRKP